MPRQTRGGLENEGKSQVYTTVECLPVDFFQLKMGFVGHTPLSRGSSVFPDRTRERVKRPTGEVLLFI